MEFGTAYARYREAFLKLRYEEDPTLVIAELVNLAQEVSHTDYLPGAFPPKPRKSLDDVSGVII